VKNFTDPEVDALLRRQERRSTLEEVQREMEKLERHIDGAGMNPHPQGYYLYRQDVLDILNRLQG
jgi:hypothetical protein